MRPRLPFIVAALVLVAMFAPPRASAQPVATYLPFPATPANLLRGDVDLTPRYFPPGAFDTYAYLPTQASLIELDTTVPAIASITPLPSFSVRGIDFIPTPDGTMGVHLTIGHVTVWDITVSPPAILASFLNTDTPVSDCDPQIVDTGAGVYCIVPYVSSIRCLYLGPGPIASVYINPRTSIGLDAVDPHIMFVGGVYRVIVPNVASVDFFDLTTGAAYASTGIAHLPKREIDMVPDGAFIYWLLDGAIYRFDPLLGIIVGPLIFIAGTTVEGCDMGIVPGHPLYGTLAVAPTTGFLHFVSLPGWGLLASVPTPGAVVRNFDPLLTPWDTDGDPFPDPDGTTYWSVIGVTYAVDHTAFTTTVILTPGGLTDAVDLTASNDYVYGCLPHPGFAHAIDLTTATLVGGGPGTIMLPGSTLRVDVDPLFPTAPVGPAGSRIVQPFLGGLLDMSGFTGASFECVMPTLSTVYVLDLAALAITAAFPIGPLAAGVDPVITQGALSPFDDDPNTVRDRDQDFLCNRQQMTPYFCRPWWIPYWPLRTPWWRTWGVPVPYQYDWWGRAKLVLLDDRQTVQLVDLFGNPYASVLLNDVVIGGAVYDRDWRYCKFYLRNKSEAIIYLNQINPLTYLPQPFVQYVLFPQAVYWPPAHDHWNGHEILLSDYGHRLVIVNSATSAIVQTFLLPYPAIHPPSMDYKNKLCGILLRNSYRCIVDLHPLAIGSSAIISVVPFYAPTRWLPMCQTVYDPMNLCSLDMFYDPISFRYGIYAAHALTGAYLWHDWLPYRPYGRLFIEKKSKLAKVPLFGGYEYLMDLTPLAWGALPLAGTIWLGHAWSFEPVWDYCNRWEVNVCKPDRITIVDARTRLIVAAYVTPFPIVGPPVIDGINKYLRVRLFGNQSFFVDLFKLAAGLPGPTRVDAYVGNLTDEAIFDPTGGYDIAVVNANLLVVTRSRPGMVVANVPLPGNLVRPPLYDAHNRSLECLLDTGQEALVDLADLNDGGGAPLVYNVPLPMLPFSFSDQTPPGPCNTALVTFSPIGADGISVMSGAPGAVEPNAYVTIMNDTDASVEGIEVMADDFGAFRAYVPVRSGDQLCILQADAATNVSAPCCLTVPPLPTGVGDEHPKPAFGLETPTPNPFFRSVEIRFSLEKRGDIQLDVFDVGGRLVRTIESGSLDEGTYLRTWDGTDRDGRRVAAGVYFVKLAAPGHEQVERAVKIE